MSEVNLMKCTVEICDYYNTTVESSHTRFFKSVEDVNEWADRELSFITECNDWILFPAVKVYHNDKLICEKGDKSMIIDEIEKETEIETEENKTVIGKTKESINNFFNNLGLYMYMHPIAYMLGCMCFGLVLRIIICHFGGYDFWRTGFVKKDNK